MILVQDVLRHLRQGRFDLNNETSTQASMHRYLRDCLPEADIKREFSLSPADRPDFLIDNRIVIEVKVRAAKSKRAIWAQLERYAAHDQVTDVILATNKAMGLPTHSQGKSIWYVAMGRAWL